LRSDLALESSYRFCASLARREARNFYSAFLLLPRQRRWSMCALYAFLRRTDDLVDEPNSTAKKAQLLDGWRGELDAALSGRPAVWPGLLALSDTVIRHGIPVQLLHEVIDGVWMDVQPRLYATFQDLADYCHHVASVVGLSCLHIWGYQSDGGRAEALAEHCGIALQLTNIIRDVREDACNGRIYLPQDDLARFGVGAEELAAHGSSSDRVRALLAFQGQRAYQFYEDVYRLAPLVAPVGRPVLLTIVGIYRALLDEIAHRDYNVQSGRISIPSWRKIAIALHSLAARFGGSDTRNKPGTGSSASSDIVVPLT
jgi:15-cis-phytoene synthase